MNASQPNPAPRSLHEWEGFWRNQLRNNAHRDITEGERIGIEVQAYGWAYQSVHGRGVVPRDLMLKKLANVLGFPPAFVDRCMEPLPRLPFEMVEDAAPYPPAEPDENELA